MMPKHEKKPIWRRLLHYIGMICGVVGIVLLIFIVVFSYKTHVTPVTLYRMLFSQTPPLTQLAGRTNILVLGMAGGDHAGGDLADSIMVMTVDSTRDSIQLLSVPRDIWVPSMQDKVNTAYHYGFERDGEEGSRVLSKAAVEEVTGIPIHYIWQLDFSGFERIIDALGGITVVIERGFTDARYPIAGRENDECDGDSEYACRYKTVSFLEGSHHMSGEEALMYVRSRNAVGAEGTDIARGQRQQQVLKAVIARVLTPKVFLNVGQIQKIEETVDQTINTDLSFEDMLFVAREFLENHTHGLEAITLPTVDGKTVEDGILVNPPSWEYDGRWVLVPKNNDFPLLHEYIACRSARKDSCEALYTAD